MASQVAGFLTSYFQLEQWKRNWRIAESRLLFFALLISVTAVSSVTFFANRTEQAMQRQASQVLGGDLVVQSSRPLPDRYLQQAKSLGLRTAEIISFPSMVLAGEKSQLVQVKAASKNYPLFGELYIADSLSSTGNSTAFDSLSTGKAWAEPHLFRALEIPVQSKVQLGQKTIELAGVISKSPDQGSSVFEFMPVLLIPLSDLPDTGLLSPASRARFSQFYAGKPQQINAFRNWLKPQLQTAESIRSIKDGLPSIQQALQRGEQFLSLASLLSVILAGVAIALTSYSLSQRETNTVAVLKTLGASRKQIIGRYFSQLFILATSAALLGIMLGFIGQAGLAYLLRDLIGQTLPDPGFQPVLSGLLTAWVMVLGFSLPQLVRLIHILPMQIFQGQRPGVSKRLSTVLSAIAIILGMSVLIWLQIKDVRLSLSLLLGLIVIMGCFWLVAVLLLRVLSSINLKNKKGLLATALKLPLPRANFRIALLIMVFGMGFFSLLLLTALRTDLINRWQDTLPDNAPNTFLINVQPNEVATFNQYFKDRGYAKAPSYPMIRGRLKAINGKAVVAEDFDSRRARGLLNREANLSTASELPEDNTLLAGEWFAPDSTHGLSVEEGITEVFNLKLGDTLRFDIGGHSYEEAVTSIRAVRWDSMQPNFFILAAPQALLNMPRTYMTSVYIPPDDKHFTPDLVKQFPSVSAIDISTILSKIKMLINKAAFAVQTIFVFTLLSGIAVLFAALQSQKAERKKEIAILKSIGARHSYLRKSIITEFAMIGALAGLIAALFAMLVSNLLAYQLFELRPQINPYLVMVGMLSGALLVGTGGYMNLRPLFKVSPRSLFQE